MRTSTVRRVLAQLAFAACAVEAPAMDLQVVRLTNDSFADETPVVHGSRIAWLKNWDVLLFDGAKAISLTDDSDLHGPPLLSDSRVIWVTCEEPDEFGCFPGVFWTLFAYDGVQVAQLTDGTAHVTGFDVDGSRIVWSIAGEVFLDDGQKTRQLTEQAGQGLPPAFGPAISGSRVVWRAGGEVFSFDGDEATQITENADTGLGKSIRQLDVSGVRVVWSDLVEGDREIFHHDGEKVLQLTDNDVDDWDPVLSGRRVVWWACEGSTARNCEVYLFDGEQSAPLTDNDYADSHPQLSGTNVVWEGRPEGDYGDSEIFFWDGSSVQRVTRNDHADELGNGNRGGSISGSRFAWYGCPGSVSCVSSARPYGTLRSAEIFVAPEPLAQVQGVVAMACLVVVLRWRRGRRC